MLGRCGPLAQDCLIFVTYRYNMLQFTGSRPLDLRHAAAAVTRRCVATSPDTAGWIRIAAFRRKLKSAALNLGISASTGDAIIVLDDDDPFPPRTVAKHAEALERNAAADFSFGRFVRFCGDRPGIFRPLG